MPPALLHLEKVYTRQARHLCVLPSELDSLSQAERAYIAFKKRASGCLSDRYWSPERVIRVLRYGRQVRMHDNVRLLRTAVVAIRRQMVSALVPACVRIAHY